MTDETRQSPAETVSHGQHCPRCNSPKPHLHPAAQFEGETQICAHAFHLIVTNQNPPRQLGGSHQPEGER